MSVIQLIIGVMASFSLLTKPERTEHLQIDRGISKCTFPKYNASLFIETATF